MLIELWERLRGYDKWIEAQATIRSSTEQKTEEYYRGQKYDVFTSDDELVWTDTQGVERTAELDVAEDSPLFQLIGGETVTIRYNPSDPGQFFYPELLRGQIVSTVRGLSILLAFLFLAFVPFQIFRWVFSAKHWSGHP
jgi:hypothetical protein